MNIQNYASNESWCVLSQAIWIVEFNEGISDNNLHKDFRGEILTDNLL